MEKNNLPPRPSDADQLIKYADDLVKVYQSEKEKRKELEAANQLLKKYNRALQESKQRYKTLFNSASDAIFIYDLAGRFKAMNQVACERLGYSQKELLQMTLMDIETPDYAKQSSKQIKAIRQHGHIVFETAHVQRDGKIIPIEASSRLVEYAKKAAILMIARDISERKRTDELKRQLDQALKMESIGNLAGGIAHDINNILFPVMGYTEMAMEDVLEESETYNNLEQIFKGTKRAKELVSQILAFSRQSEQEQKPVKLGPIVKEALKLISASLPSTIEIRQNIDSEAGAVMADSTKIHQVIMNLCTNAYHAMKASGGVLEVNLSGAYVDSNTSFLNLETGPYLKLTVSDTGHGMDHALMERIFEPYFTTKAQGAGTGMGLSVVHGIIRSHGGEIKAFSRPGVGTTFDIFLPCIKAVAVESKTGPVAPAPRGRESILLVGDEAEITHLMQKMLERLGYQVSAHNDSVKALETFRAKPKMYALVITDQIMPNMTGTDLAKEIMDIRSDIPIIVCSGTGEEITDEEAKALGIREHIQKPVEKIRLAKSIRRVLDIDKICILVIDDDDQIRDMLRKMLERSGYDVEEAADGIEGIRLYRQKPVDLIITDILMPKKDGKETILEIREESPDAKIIAMTGGGWIGPEIDLDIAEKLGAMRTFAKPIQQEELLEAVRELLE